jgi:hypothetical protein
MEVYKGKGVDEDKVEKNDDMLEIELNEEEAELVAKFLAIAIFYSRKSYNLQVLYADIILA